MALPNGSRLSGGRDPRGRKAVERQTKRLVGEATQFFPTGSARQLQAHVRRRALRSGSRDLERIPCRRVAFAKHESNVSPGGRPLDTEGDLVAVLNGRA